MTYHIYHMSRVTCDRSLEKGVNTRRRLTARIVTDLYAIPHSVVKTCWAGLYILGFRSLARVRSVGTWKAPCEQGESHRETRIKQTKTLTLSFIVTSGFSSSSIAPALAPDAFKGPKLLDRGCVLSPTPPTHPGAPQRLRELVACKLG